MLGLLNIKDLLTSFSPSADFLAITSGDGRIKIWDTLKGQVQTEFADITSADDTNFYSNPRRGHLSLDYTCMKWCLLGNERKKKPVSSLLVLGTGSGDVLALDVSVGQLRWRVNDCHPGGVSAISFSSHALTLYTAGVDGMACQIDSQTGNLLGKFHSTKALSSIAVSSDGKLLATAAAQLRIFNCSDTDNKKIQKFSGHSVSVRCMIFTEDGKCVLSSAVGERYVAVWTIDGSKKRSASCFLSMEHPAVFLDSKGTEDVGLYVIAISEIGVCYFWHGRNIEELHTTKPTKISVSSPSPEPALSKPHRSAMPMIFAAKLQEIVTPDSGLVFAAFGSLVKPSFEKISVRHGLDINVSPSDDGVLLPVKQSVKSQKRNGLQTQVTALDRANAEDAILPIPRLHDIREKKRKHKTQESTRDPVEATTNFSVNSTVEVWPASKDEREDGEEDYKSESMLDNLRSLGILNASNEDNQSRESYPRIPINLALHSTEFDDADPFHSLLTEADMPVRKIRAAILSMGSSDAYKFLTVLIATLKSRSGCASYVLPWIHGILVNHSSYIISEEASTQLLETVYEIGSTCEAGIEDTIAEISDLESASNDQVQMFNNSTVVAVIWSPAAHNGTGRGSISADKVDVDASKMISSDQEMDKSEDEDEDIDEFVYGEEDESQSSSDVDNQEEHGV